MKEQIKKHLKLSGVKYWTALAVLVNRNPDCNFKRMLFWNIDKLNDWLKPIGLELCVKEIEKGSET